MQTAFSDDTISRHKCLIYDGDPAEQLPVVVPLLLDGFARNYRCLYLGAQDTLDMVADALRDKGVDPHREVKRGALVLSADRSHLDGGAFNPRAMIDGLCASIDEAVHDGFAGLCATGDMRWELGDDGNFAHLLEYEALLERVFRDRPLRGICQYHRSTVPSHAVRDALMTHRTAFVGNALNRDNLFYVPPEILLDARASADGADHSEWMCQQIIRVLDAEETRDKALHALRASESHQRHLAEQLAVINQDLERRVAERTAELETANQQLESFAYSVSHDLRAPIRAIRGFSDILTEDHAPALGDEVVGYLNRIRTSTQRMEELVDAILSLSRAIKTELHPVPVDVSVLADEIVAEVRGASPPRDAYVSVERGLRARGDVVLLRAALTNLIANAWKFTSKTERTRIEVGQERNAQGTMVFFVRDNGAGFDSTRAPRLFGAFERMHSNDEFPGTGVGLATVRRIVSRHGGRIWAESREGEGATFYFTLPA